MKKKICLVLPTLEDGGAEKVAFHLLSNLNEEKYELSLILTNTGGEKVLKLKNSIKVIELKYKRVRYSIFKLFSNLKTLNPDIVMVLSSEISTIIGLFIVPFFRKSKFVTREINIQSILMRSKIRKILLRLSYKNVYKIISQSKDMTEDLVNYTKISLNKIVEINNPIDMKHIDKFLKEEEINLFCNNCFNLVCVGRLVYQKGFDLIINIMEKIKEKNIKLYIIGEGNERKRLEQQVLKLGLKNKIFFLGKKSNPYIYMKNADLFILSSRFEGFPNVLLEANACGTYAICNNILGGVNEIIRENINGNIVDFNDVNKTSELIIEKLNIKKEKEKIREVVLSKYNLSTIIGKYEYFFDNL